MNKYENSKVDMLGMTDEHIKIFVQTLADLGAEKFAPNIEVKVNLEK